jgi:hypothetical protein
MDNFGLHDQAQQLADTRSAYSLARELLELKASQIAWRNTGSPNGLRRFMTQKQYAAQTPGVQKWYEPITVPEGWQLVPIEPTQEMVKAVENYRVETWDGGEWTSSKKAIGIYHDMLAAAPKPEPTK